MVRVITVGREHGSGGRAIARRAAEKLGWRLLDRDVLDQVARLAQVPPEDAELYDEQMNPWLVRLVKSLWAGSPVFTGVPPADVFDADMMVRLTRRVMVQAADAGECVIVGRGGQCILRDRADAFHVFIYAPLADRIRRVRPQFADDRSAQLALEQSDRLRAHYVHHYYGCDWGNRELYGLQLNSALGEERAAEVIVCAAGLRPLP